MAAALEADLVADLGIGAQRVLDAKVPVDRIVNSWPAEKLLEWTAS